MANRYGATAKLSIAAIAVGIFTATSTATAFAIPLSRAAWPIYTAVVEKTTPPDGWVEFCRNYKTECDVKSSEPLKIALTPEVWDKLVDVNRWANGHIKPTPDRKHWGRINKWYFAEDGRGDCKDYVLVKRRMLIQAGLPREALLISVVWTPQDNGHAVLIVRTDKGDYILDNLSSKVVLWNQTPYDYVMRQTQSNPNAWVYIDGNPLKPSKIAAEEIAENPRNEPTIIVSGLNNGMPKQEVIAAKEIDNNKPKPQMVASRAIDDSTPNKVTATRAIDDNVPAKEAIASHESAAATSKQHSAIAPANDSPKQQMNTTIVDAGSTPRQEVTAIDVVDSNTLRQLLASGVDGDTLMQLVIAGNLKPGGMPTQLLAQARIMDRNEATQLASAVSAAMR
jgi:predicted transglutaminase-like cysteine proteinase